jgi:predicted MFS family arabinose efflux permease
MSTIATATPIPAEERGSAILTPEMLVLAGTMLTAMGSFYLLLSAIPAHAATLGGASAAGLSTGALMATTIIGELAAPRLIASLGRRPALAAALLTMALPCLATFSNSLPLLLATCAARGLGLGILLVAACGLASQLAPAGRRAEALGVFGVASAIPAIVAVPLGPWTLATLGSGVTASIAAALAIAALATVAFLPKGVPAPRDDPHAVSFPPLRASVWPTTALGVGAIVVGAAITFLPLAHPELDEATIMVALLLQGLGAACARWAAGRPVDRHGPRAALIGATALSIVGLVCLALPGAFGVLGAMAISGIAFGVVQSASLSQMLDRATPAQADAVGALWNGAYDAGLGVGGLAIGGLATMLGYGAAFLVAGLGLAALAVAIFLRFETRKSSC